jgi:hypothetical protein
MTMNRRNVLKSLGLALCASTAPAEDLFRTGVDVESPQPKVTLNAEVRLRDGRPTILINGQPESPIIYALTDCPGGRWPWEELPAESMANFVRQGFRLFQVDIWLSQMLPENGPLDLHLVREQIRGILRLKPEAAVFLRVHVNAPDWWKKKNPREWTEFFDGPVAPPNGFGLRRLLDDDLDRIPQASLASQPWRADLSAVLADFCKQLSATPEGKCVAGMQVACGIYGEWHYWGFFSHDPDNGPPMTAHFRAWLKAKYKTEQALQTAWNNPAATFTSVEVPGLEARHQSGDGIFRDPARQQQVIDYFTCQHQVVAQDIVHFCGVVKKSWPRPIITGTFYGYYFSVFGREQQGGHLDEEDVLNSSNVDYLSGPQAYYSTTFRDVGGTGQSRGVLESCRLHGKLWLDEMDQAPHIDVRRSIMEGSETHKPNRPEAIAVLRRNVMQTMIHGMGLWFYDFGYSNQSGWWNDPALLEEIRAHKRIFDRYSIKPYRSVADVLVVYNTDVFYHVTDVQEASGLVSWSLSNEISAQMYHTGVAFDQVYLSSLSRVDLSRYRAIVFANALVLSAEQKDWIARNTARSGRHLVWTCAPGFSDASRLSSQFITEVTGMQVERVTGNAAPVVSIESKKLPSARLYAEGSYATSQPLAFGSSSQPIAVDPLFAIHDPSVEVHGHLEGSRQPGIACRRFADHASWFCSVPILNPGVLRAILQDAGAHIYSDAGDVIHANHDLLLVHSKDGGPREFRLAGGTTIKTQLAPASTTLFDMENGTVLLGGSANEKQS